ncbi:hypothetical protein BSLG_008100 [Batrachochytrium salamandrivorans]|nr:hypothetical protein BSLG_008100 [Batrachochytrium salamandrivorans]
MPLLAPQAVPTAFEGLLNSGLLDMPDTSSAPDTLNKCQSWIDSASFLTPLATYQGTASSDTTIRVRIAKHNPFLTPSSWVSYKLLTSDHITNTITVVTKVHTFDHLVFGDWHAHSSISDSNKDKDDAEPDVFLCIELSWSNSTFLAESLPHGSWWTCNCNGIVPPPLAPYTAPPSPPPPSIVSATTPTEENALESLMPLPIHTSPTGGARIQHSCPSCEYYDTQKVRRSIFVFDQVPLHPTWAKDGVTYQHAYKDSKRTLLVTVKPSSGRMFQDDLPVVTLNRLEINGTKLNPNYYSLFLKLVHQR